ncbi:aspartate/glutamate racemase family protein [Saccharospirillum alexandrii]|uniref:aspartate/glutamate racemase family protein n=1 Tax=Saccharospirillum alexandrii TaxID=2448477 RepID=UPI001C704F44|nr:aspartate/glutamate racemase family protein [Saccharospirillum alexandrii]
MKYNPNPRIYLIHAVKAAMLPVQEQLSVQWPEAEICNLLDDSLERDKTKPGADLSGRILDLTYTAVKSGANGILFTCSAFGEAIESAAAQFRIPVLKPNEAMFHQAINTGKRVAMLATFEPAMAGMEREFQEMLGTQHRPVEFLPVFVPGARDALNAGDIDTHDKLVAECASNLEGVDTIMLAHFSTASALSTVTALTNAAVLTSPATAVAMLRESVQHALTQTKPPQ